MQACYEEHKGDPVRRTGCPPASVCEKSLNYCTHLFVCVAPAPDIVLHCRIRAYWPRRGRGLCAPAFSASLQSSACLVACGNYQGCCDRQQWLIERTCFMQVC